MLIMSDRVRVGRYAPMLRSRIDRVTKSLCKQVTDSNAKHVLT